MSVLRRNVVANYAAKLWSAALGLAFPPIYVHLLGIESYGLVGFFASLSAMLSVLDLGLGTTLQRELAALSSVDSPDAAQKARDLVRTFEIVFWVTGSIAGIIVVSAAPLLVDRWLHIEHLSRSVAVNAIRVMGAVFAFQWCGLVYSGALFALERQVPANVILIIGGTVRSAGSALFVWLVWRSATGLFVAQAMAMALQMALLAHQLSRSIPSTRPGAAKLSMLRRTWRFSVGTWAISILGVALSQLDKAVVSKVLPLDALGYYALAGTASAALVYVSGPVYAAVFPRLCALVASQREPEVAQLYHNSTQVLSVVVLSAAAALCAFPHEALFAWTGDHETVRRASGILVALSIGTAMNGVLHMPLALQFAYGWTRLTFGVNVVLVLVMVPLMFVLGSHIGVIGIATSWILMNASSLLVVVPLMHRRLLVGELRRWWTSDVICPCAGAVAGAFAVRGLLGSPQGRLTCALSFVAAGSAAVVASSLATAYTRQWIRTRLRAAVAA